MSNIEVVDLGNIEYGEALKYQKQLFEKNLNLKINGLPTKNYLLLCEHPNVYTLGKSGKQNNLLIDADFLKKINANYYQTNRGGDITYHGPGQIVGYPVFDLDTFKLGTRDYILRIENIIIKILTKYEIKGQLNNDFIGVWIDSGKISERKICALGVKVSKAVTMHGFALNVNTNLSYFNYINPCGFTDKGVTSMQKELGKKIDFNKIKSNIVSEFLKSFF